MCKLIYGCGLRLKECLNLRVKDIDFNQNCLTIRSGKGDKDRLTVLPGSLKNDLREHLAGVRDLYEIDRRDGIDGVYLPMALERKYPNAGKEWIWQWVFPSKDISVDPKTRRIRRHHIHPNTLQRQIKTPVCLDESIVSVEKARKAIHVGACGWVNIKAGRVGGLTNAIAIHDLCREAGIPCWVGGML